MTSRHHFRVQAAASNVNTMAVAKEPVTFFTVTSYFADTPKSVKKGLNSYNSNRVVNVSVLAGGSLKGKVQASMKSKVYEVEVRSRLLSDSPNGTNFYDFCCFI